MMNWNLRYAADKEAGKVGPRPPVDPIDWNEWSSHKLPTVPQGKKVTGFSGKISTSPSGGGTVGGSNYTLESDGSYTKTLSPKAQETYKTTRPNSYKILDPQGRYTENWEHTVFIDPRHNGIEHFIHHNQPVAEKQSDGSFRYKARGLIKGMPEEHIISRDSTSFEAHLGTYYIPKNHISTTPFVGATPFQHGKVTLADGSTKNAQHIGNAVGEVKYQ
jgi:hypothetical protein